MHCDYVFAETNPLSSLTPSWYSGLGFVNTCGRPSSLACPEGFSACLLTKIKKHDAQKRDQTKTLPKLEDRFFFCLLILSFNYTSVSI